MKFKGVIRAGAKAGDVVEFTAEEKVPVALQDAVIDHSDYKNHTHVWIRDVKIATLLQNPKGPKLNGKYENNQYTSHGTATLHRRSLKHDALLPPQKKMFDIKFEDVLDHIGQPDLKITEFWLRDQ